MIYDTVQTPGPEPQGTGARRQRTELRYVSQFFLGPALPDSFPAWRRVALADDLCATVHPHLTTTQVGDAARALVLIGFILDPRDPRATDEQILHDLLPCAGSIDALAAATTGYGGRWILVSTDGARRHLLHDALGLRQVYYTDVRSTGRVWAMSQPGLALRLLNLRPDPEARAFMDSFEFRSDREYRWPADASPFRELRRLLPNHRLDLDTGAVRRYWPAAPITRQDPDEAVERAAKCLSGLVQAAHRRFRLAVAATAGLDSRLVLATCRPIRKNVEYVTVRQCQMADDSCDLRVPHRLLGRYGLKQAVIRAEASMSAHFSWLYKRNLFLPHDHYGPDAEAILNRFGRTRVVVTGSGAEVARCSFRRELPLAEHRTVNALHLARLQRMGRDRFAIRHFNGWLDDAKDRHGVPLLDLFEWEQGHGVWLAATQLEFDIAWADIFTPYNCRALLETLLGVPERFRRGPDFRLFRMLIRELWPDLLSEPINPGKGRPWVQWWQMARERLHPIAPVGGAP